MTCKFKSGRLVETDTACDFEMRFSEEPYPRALYILT